MSKIDIRKFNILHDNVLIKAIEVDENDGIYKPSQYGDKPYIGEVFSVGGGRVLENGIVVPIKVKKGDKIYFNKYSTTKFNFDGIDWYIIRDEDIIAYTR